MWYSIGYLRSIVSINGIELFGSGYSLDESAALNMHRNVGLDLSTPSCLISI